MKQVGTEGQFEAYVLSTVMPWYPTFESDGACSHDRFLTACLIHWLAFISSSISKDARQKSLTP